MPFPRAGRKSRNGPPSLAALRRSDPQVPPIDVANNDDTLVISRSDRAPVREISEVVQPPSTNGLQLRSLAAARKLPSRSPSLAAAPVEAFRLVWIQPDCPAKIGRSSSWKRLVADGDSKEPTDKPLAADEVFEILARGRITDNQALRAALKAAVDEHGRFSPPALLFEGELEFVFDPLETLKATMAAIAPYAAADRQLAATLRDTQQLCTTQWLELSNEVIQRLTQKLRVAFTKRRGKLGPTYLDSTTARMLSEQRLYQRRVVFGQPCVCAYLHRAEDDDPLPVYLPAQLSTRLPLVHRSKVRLIAEVDTRQDPFESRSLALRAQAVALRCAIG